MKLFATLHRNMWPSAVSASYHLFLHSPILNPPAALWNTIQRSSLYNTSNYCPFHSLTYCTSAPFCCLVIGLLSFLLSSHWSDCAYLSPLLDSIWCSMWTLNPWRLGDIFLWNVGTYLFGETASHPRRLESLFLFVSFHAPSSYCSLCETHRTVADGCQQGNCYVCVLKLSLHDSRRLILGKAIASVAKEIPLPCLG